MSFARIAAAVLVLVGTLGSASAQRRRHHRAPHAELFATAPPRYVAPTADPIGRPELLFQDSLYPTPNQLGLAGFMVAMISLKLARHAPDSKKPLIVPIPMIGAGTFGALVWGRFQ